jgi:hypothetical protein
MAAGTPIVIAALVGFVQLDIVSSPSQSRRRRVRRVVIFAVVVCVVLGGKECLDWDERVKGPLNGKGVDRRECGGNEIPGGYSGF